LSAAIKDDVDEADRLDVLEGCYRVLGDAMDSMWTAWARFDQGQMPAGAAPEEPPLLAGAVILMLWVWRATTRRRATTRWREFPKRGVGVTAGDSAVPDDLACLVHRFCLTGVPAGQRPEIDQHVVLP